MIDSQITIDNTSEPIQGEKELIEPLINIENPSLSNEENEPLCFASDSILSNY